MRRRHLITALGTALAATAITRTAFAQATLEKLKVAGPPTEDATNIYYAVKNGLFGRAGLDVEMINTSSGTAATTAMITGTYDISRTSVMPLLTAHTRGIPIVIVGPELLTVGNNPFALLQIPVDSALRTGADLNGKTMGVPALNDQNSLATRAWVDKNGGDWRSLKFTEIPNSALEAALVQHRVDAAVLQQPALAASLAAGTSKTLGNAYSAIAQTYMSGCYAARSDWAVAHADALRRFNSVMASATNYIQSHLQESAPLVVELTKIELATAQKMHRAINATTLDAALIQPLIDAAVRYEHLQRGFPAREVLWTG
jgi:NitT/TauT family transport system substrate-binding protein